MKNAYVTKKTFETVNGHEVMVTKKYRVPLTGTEELIYRIYMNSPMATKWIQNNFHVPMETKVSPVYDIDAFTGEKLNRYSRYRRTWTDGQYEIMAIYTMEGKFDGVAVTDTDRNFLVRLDGFADHIVKRHVEYKSDYLFPWMR